MTVTHVLDHLIPAANTVEITNAKVGVARRPQDYAEDDEEASLFASVDPFS